MHGRAVSNTGGEIGQGHVRKKSVAHGCVGVDSNGGVLCGQRHGAGGGYVGRDRQQCASLDRGGRRQDGAGGEGVTVATAAAVRTGNMTRRPYRWRRGGGRPQMGADLLAIQGQLHVVRDREREAGVSQGVTGVRSGRIVYVGDMAPQRPAPSMGVGGAEGVRSGAAGRGHGGYMGYDI